MVTATQLIQPLSRLQRAIHVRYDLRDEGAINHYIPTLSATSAIGAILSGTDSNTTQRAHVLHAAYGSGKSHLAVVLAALLEKEAGLQSKLYQLADRIGDTDRRIGEMAHRYLDGRDRLLPVVLSGNEGDFSTAMSRGLARSLQEAGLDHIRLTTRFEAALATIQQWKKDYPDTLKRLDKSLSERFNRTLGNLKSAIQDHAPDAFECFASLYPDLTAGATFDPFIGQTPEVIYRKVAAQLAQGYYSGIIVLWDEFGRYLEARAAQAFSNEAALLQNFAETCNYSGENQLHLLVFAHKELQGYASTLPKAYQQEWSRIEGRFQRHNISTDPYVAYRLIASAVQHTDEQAITDLLDDRIDKLVDRSSEKHLFGMLPKESIYRLVHQTWPLHPLAVFALVHLSNRVAQNERTMFTFLTTNEPQALHNLLAAHSFDKETSLIYPAALWDYFEDAIRADTGGFDAHRFWSGVLHALDKVAEGDSLGTTLVKALGVLLICADATPVKPTTEMLCWAVGAETEEQRDAAITTLDNLRRRKAIINRQIDGYWTFISGSDINFEKRLAEVLERTNPTPIQLRRLLEQYLPAPYTLARRYNQKYAMTRYFTGLYRWPTEIAEAPWNTQIKKMDTDGLVIYVLATDELTWQQAADAIQAHDRVVYVLPDQDYVLTSLVEVLRELFGLQEISNDASLRRHEDRGRIQREINWLLEDAQVRLERLVDDLVDPRKGKSIWITTQGDMAHEYRLHSPGQATRIISDICERVFPKTPIFNSEGINKRNPSAQQVRATDMVIEAIFTHEPDATFGMEGRGPEILAFNALIKLSGILRKEDDEWAFGRPDTNPRLAEVWDHIEHYMDRFQREGGSLVTALIDELTLPPYGLREGVLPILLAAVLRSRLKVTTVLKDGRAVPTIDGGLLAQMVDSPGHYSIEVGEWNTGLENLYHSLLAHFEVYIHESEREQQALTILRVSSIRWLQGLPAFCRYTQKISAQAMSFRDLIRKAQTEPAKALFEDMPTLLEINEKSSRADIDRQLSSLMAEINNAYLDLQRRLDVFAARKFGSNGHFQDGLSALKGWLIGLQAQNGRAIQEFKFGSLVTQDFVDAVLETSGSDGVFWDKASQAVLGLKLRDWNDQSEDRFYERLYTARDEVEREVQELIEEDAVVALSVHLPDDASHEYRFRSSDLSKQGQHILQNFKSTLEIAGRPLSVDEKRQIAVAFLVHVMGEQLDD